MILLHLKPHSSSWFTPYFPFKCLNHLRRRGPVVGLTFVLDLHHTFGQICCTSTKFSRKLKLYGCQALNLRISTYSANWCTFLCTTVKCTEILHKFWDSAFWDTQKGRIPLNLQPGNPGYVLSFCPKSRYLVRLQDFNFAILLISVQ